MSPLAIFQNTDAGDPGPVANWVGFRMILRSGYKQYIVLQVIFSALAIGWKEKNRAWNTSALVVSKVSLC